VIGDHGYEGDREVGPWQAPAAISAQDRVHALESLTAHQLWLQPAQPQAVSARIATMLAHFYVGAADPAVHAAIAGDWITLLAGFPQHVVDAVCLEWLAEHDRRPMIATIVRACRERVAVPRKLAQRLEVLAALPAL
jgi:hypothetical protein